MADDEVARTNIGLGNVLAMESTGRLTGGAVTATPGGTTFNLALGTGKIVDYTNQLSPTITQVSWGASSSVAITNIATQPATLI